MGFGEKIIPLGGVNTDLHESLMPPNLATFIKNLVYEITDTADAGATKGSQTGVFKPLQSNALYINNLVIPDGYNQTMGTFSFRELRQVFVCLYNENGNHLIYRLNGDDQTYNVVYQGPLLNFQLDPQFFIHQGGFWLEQIFVTDPVTSEERIRTFIFITDGFNAQRFICVEDSIATQSFNENMFPYFNGNYDRAGLINMGVLTPSDCITVNEVPLDQTAETQNNRLLFNTWQFRLLYTDVWGRPSEHGIISDLYIPGEGDCIANSSGLARCLDLLFNAPPPYINSIQVEYRNCNSSQWYLSDILELYDGSPLGDWWLRSRNSSVAYDSSTNKISYRFCADKKCDPLPVTETIRLFNPLPRISQAVTAVGSFINLSNNVDGFLPFSHALKNEMSFTVIPPTDAASANNFRNISILVEIFNFKNTGPNGVGNGMIFFYNNHYYFQRLPLFKTVPAALNIEPSYSQFFANANQQGFIGYLAGSNTFTISEQYSLDSSGVFNKVTDFTKFDMNLKYFQKFTFSNVKKGKYIFRIAGLTVNPAVDTPATMFKTSTYVIGLFPFNIMNPIAPVTHDLATNNYSKELLVDVCNGDYDSVKDNKILVIADWTHSGGPVDQGYVRNTNDTTVDQFGIELMWVQNGYLNSKWTDHNGYFFVGFTVGGGGGGHYYIKGYCNCKIANVANNVSSGTSNQQFTDNYYMNTLPVSTGCPNYNTTPCNYVLIRGRVVTCGGVPVPGISVTLTRGASAVTGSDGFFGILAHDDVITGRRTDSLIFNTNSCNFTECDGTCFSVIDISFTPCITCNAREIDVSDKTILFKTAKGLLSGGAYPGGFVGWDDHDRPTFVQQDSSYLINIPSVQQTQIFAPSTVRVDISPTAIFPPETKYITPWIGTETTIEEYITWIVDSFQLIDNTGLVNTIAPTQIKIFYASLIEYNKQNNYNTTVNWSFIPAGSTTPVLSDKVEFLLNGDGTFFTKAISALVKYDTIGQFFLINYTQDLKDLKANAIIRILRPKACTGTEPYFEICQKIPIIDRKAAVTSFILNAFDTYYINRQIPVPTLQPNSSPPTYINEPRAFGVPFESSSPSDFWGLNCKNIGRVNSKNPYETVIFSPDQMALSGALSPTGQLNFLNYFDDAKKVDFSDTLINGITSVLPETSTILVLGQTDSFIVGFNDNIARVNSQGQVMAPSIENQFGQPERKVGSNYGCLLADKNTIYKKEGIVQFLDTCKAVVVQHNYQTAIPMSNNGAEGLIRAKIKNVQAYNLVITNNRRYFVGVINPINHEYLLTDFVIKGNSFINSLRESDPTVQETLVFDVFAKAFKGWLSFTAEYYSELEGELNDQQLFSFKNGLPYRHYTSLEPTSYNTFYGTICERILEVVIVMDNLKKKKPLAWAEYCKQGAYFADQITTETGQRSRILLPYFIEAEFGWFAPFLCDLNTPFDPNLLQQTGPNALLDGNMLTGTWIKVRMVGDPAINDQYSEFQGIATEVMPSEKSGVK